MPGTQLGAQHAPAPRSRRRRRRRRPRSRGGRRPARSATTSAQRASARVEHGHVGRASRPSAARRRRRRPRARAAGCRRRRPRRDRASARPGAAPPGRARQGRQERRAAGGSDRHRRRRAARHPAPASIPRRRRCWRCPRSRARPRGSRRRARPHDHLAQPRLTTPSAARARRRAAGPGRTRRPARRRPRRPRRAYAVATGSPVGPDTVTGTRLEAGRDGGVEGAVAAVGDGHRATLDVGRRRGAARGPRPRHASAAGERALELVGRHEHPRPPSCTGAAVESRTTSSWPTRGVAGAAPARSSASASACAPMSHHRQPHGGQRGRQVLGHGDVVEARHRHPAGHRDAARRAAPRARRSPCRR